ncbi:MAG TPA: hypothetical protein VFD50_03170 [Thermoleophilia bacterium]|nr:hypothetical protein [Thermoleophilia bacterium]
MQHLCTPDTTGDHAFLMMLNLFLSMLAGVQAAALLIAAKRADAIASEVATHTEKNTEDLKGLMQENTAMTLQVKKNTDLLEEIHRHVTALGAPLVLPDERDDAEGSPPST